MKNYKYSDYFFIGLLVLTIGAGGLFATVYGEHEDIKLDQLLPEIKTWNQTEKAQTYFPESLFEYINGAAEVYLSYEFKELIVAQYKLQDAAHNISIEIYDMGNSINAFGIYSAERFPENQFVDIGLQGYQEEGALNFFGGRYYVKLLCFDCEAQSGDILTNFAKEIVKRSGNISAFPALLSVFPKEGLLPYTEKFILRNFMGYSFLHDGFLASYKAGGQEFDCFIIDGKNAEETQEMVKRFLSAKGEGEQPLEKISPLTYHIKDKYYHNIYLAHKGKRICGVMKIEDGSELIGEKYLGALLENLQKLELQ